MNPFEIGDVVYLKSGSEAMTITTIDNDYCQVTWHDYQGKLQFARHNYRTLTKKNPYQPDTETLAPKVGF